MTMGFSGFGAGGAGAPGGLTSNGSNITGLAFPAGIGTWATVTLNAGGTATIFAGLSNTNGQDTWQIGDSTNLFGYSIRCSTNGILRATTHFIQNAAGSVDWLVVDTNGVHGAVPFAGSSADSKASAFKSSSGGTLVIAASAVTLSAAQYQCFILVLTGTPAADRTVIGPGTSTDEFHFVFNNSNNAQTFKAAATAGVAIPAGKCALIWWNGADYQILGAAAGF